MPDPQNNEITRIRFDGRVYRWERLDSSWPGKTCFLAIFEHAITIGDRYADEDFECVFQCHPRDFLDGCFHESIIDTFGAGVLGEVVVEVRHVEPARPEPQPQTPARETLTPMPAAPSIHKTSPATAPSSASPDTGLVSVAVTECGTVDMVLAVALRSITRAPIKSLLARLKTRPCVLATDISISDGKAIQQRLAGLGVTVEVRR